MIKEIYDKMAVELKNQERSIAVNYIIA